MHTILNILSPTQSSPVSFPYSHWSIYYSQMVSFIFLCHFKNLDSICKRKVKKYVSFCLILLSMISSSNHFPEGSCSFFLWLELVQTPLITALGRQRQAEMCVFKVILVYILSSRSAWMSQ